MMRMETREPDQQRGWRLAMAGLVVLGLGCGGDETTPATVDEVAAPGFEDSTLNTYELAVIPDTSTLLSLLDRPEEPFVMTNMLVFKEMATGVGFEGLTGAEAYQLYVDGLVDAQAAIGSRLIWAGEVQAQVVGSSDPPFQVMALLEYASPSAFIGFASDPGDTPEARIAGLHGQWLVASTTVEEHAVPSDQSAPTELPPSEELVKTTGLTSEQLGRLLAGPEDEAVFIVDLLRFADGSNEAYLPYQQALALAVEAQQGSLVWRGAYYLFVLGEASPSFDEMVVTHYPNRAAYLSVLADAAVVAASDSRVHGLALHWIYACGPGGTLDFGN